MGDGVVPAQRWEKFPTSTHCYNESNLIFYFVKTFIAHNIRRLREF